jgi:ribonuclease D
MMNVNQCVESTVSTEELPFEVGLPLVAFEGEIRVVDTRQQIKEAIAYLSAQEMIGFDTETKPKFIPGKRNGNHVALLQLTTDERAYLFRLNKIGLPREITELLANKNVLKIGAAVHEDLRQLQAAHRFKPDGFIDLQKIVQDYGIAEKGVKKMAARVLQIRISKSQQLSNWECAHLSRSQCLYAATDAWVCREIFVHLQKRTPLSTP